MSFKGMTISKTQRRNLSNLRIHSLLYLPTTVVVVVINIILKYGISESPP